MAKDEVIVPVTKHDEPKVEEPTAPKVIVEEPKAETVTISKESLDELIDRLKRVEAAADKGRLSRIDDASERDTYYKLIQGSTEFLQNTPITFYLPLFLAPSFLATTT